MGLFKRKSEEPAEGGPVSDRMALARLCQGWLGMLPADAATQLLGRAA